MAYYFDKSALCREFRDAITMSEMLHVKWQSIYADRFGELCISFKGELSEDEIKLIRLHFIDIIEGDTDVDSVTANYEEDYVYRDGCTDIFTPDGLDYNRVIFGI